MKWLLLAILWLNAIGALLTAHMLHSGWRINASRAMVLVCVAWTLTEVRDAWKRSRVRNSPSILAE